MSLDIAYARAFCKTAADNGVDPVALAKLAGKEFDDWKDMLADTVSMPGSLVSARREQILNELAGADGNVKPRAHATAELLGPFTSVVAPGLAGAGLGALIGKLSRKKDGTSKGALIGWGAGAGLGHLGNGLATILAAVKRRRTAKEQMENDSKSVLLPLLVPGKGTYDMWKRNGRSYEENRDRIKDRKESNKKKDGGKEKKAAAPGLFDMLHNAYTTLDPQLRRAIIGGLITGAGTYMMADNDENGSKLLKGLTAGALGGLGTYAMDNSGMTDSMIDYIKGNIDRLRPARYGRRFMR